MENEYNDRNSFRSLISGVDPERENSKIGTQRIDSALRNDAFQEDQEEIRREFITGSNKNVDDHEKEKEEAKQMSELFSHIDAFIEAIQSGDASTKTKQSTTTRFEDPDTASASCVVLDCPIKSVESSVSLNTKRMILNQPIDAEEFGRMEPMQLEQHERLLTPSPMTALSRSLGNLTRRESEDDNKAAANDTKESKVRRRRRNTFPQQLHAMLETAQENGHDDIISWQKHGKAFMVKDKERFVTTILPNYFHQTQYRSFQRQLALYGFIRHTTANSDDYGSYYHPNFVQGCPSLCHKIQRTAIKGAATASAKGLLSLSQPADPDFATRYDYDADNNTNNSGYREIFEQNTINPFNMAPIIPLDNPRNSLQHKTAEIKKSTTSKQENQPHDMVINDSAAHHSNKKNDDSYYDNECDDDIDNFSMAEFLSDVDL